MIYLDNAATTRPCPAALDAMRTALEDAWGNPSTLYRPGQQAPGSLSNGDTKFMCRLRPV